MQRGWRGILGSLLLATGVGWGPLAMAQDVDGQSVSTPRIGVVNTARILEQAPRAREARNRLEAEFAVRDRELIDMQRQIRVLEEQLQREADALPEEERRQLERDIVLSRRELRRAQEEFREDFNIRRNEELSKLQREVYATIVEEAKREGYDLILEAGVIYSSDEVEITDIILERLQ